MITLKKCISNIYKYFYTTKTLTNSNEKAIKITFHSTPHTLYVSLVLLVDNFGYFTKKNNLKIFDKNDNCINISCITNDTFETLLEVITNG